MFASIPTLCCVNALHILAYASTRSGLLCAGWRSIKKTTFYAQRNHGKRIAYLKKLRQLIAEYGSQNLVYFDESGFRARSYRPHGWARRGQKIFGNISATNRKTQNLIMAQRGKQWLAPLLFEHTCKAETVNQWIQNNLLPKLDQPSVIIMDNAPFHNKQQIQNILQTKGHILLPLPPYSPDFNPIEQTFATIKKRRQFHPTHDLNLILMSNSYLE
jgi:transposase